MLHKIYIGIIVAVIAIWAVSWLRAHDAWKDLQRDLAVSNAKIQQNNKVEQKDQATEKAANVKVTVDQQRNDELDKYYQNRIAELEKQRDSHPDNAQIKPIIEEAVPGLVVREITDAAGTPVLAVDSTQQSRDAINTSISNFKICTSGLDNCQQKQQNYLDIIAQKQTVIDAQQDTIKLKQNSIDTLTGDLKKATSFGKGGNFWVRTGRVYIPLGCAGVSAWAASQAKASAKTVGIAAGGAGALCAIKFHF